ncbi:MULTISPECIES: hypothetical protein [Streptomyces]|uniref:hypothetical protein n=1 Tax=Streptomyces TaxID=1883 RepID=UPI001924F807|nr:MULTISPECIES: hypothetical protein [Streptomyces]MCM9079245.1 hypothetical protein [Streptomyces spororaveus]MCX5306331.1 hypothetical protein [Streptomyces sp. NBC_00160]
MTKTSVTRRPDERRQWLPVAALFTVLGPVAVWCGRATSYLPGFPPGLVWFYALPVAMVAFTWIPPRTDAQRGRRLAVGSAGCLLAFFYPHLVLVTILTLWGFSGG